MRLQITKSRIGRKLLLATLLYSTVVTLGVAVTEVYLDYRMELQSVEANFSFIEKSYQEGLSQSLWVYDDEQTRVQLSGILGLPGVAYVEITNQDERLDSAGTLPDDRSLERNIPLNWTEGDRIHRLGTLRVVNDLGQIFATLRERLFLTVAGSAVLVFLIAGFITLIFHLLVTRHILALTARISPLGSDSGGTLPPAQAIRGLGELDEVGQLVAAIEPMQERIRESFTALVRSEQHVRKLITQMASGFALHEMIYDADGEPVDYRFIDVNDAFTRITGLDADAVVGRTVKEVLPNTEEVWIRNYAEVASTGVPMNFENYSIELERHFDVIAYSPEKGQFATIFNDITDRKAIEIHQAEQRELLEGMVRERTEALQQRVQETEQLNAAMVNLLDDLQQSNRKLEQVTEELASSNAELESFSYSVSHDLRAPLRAIEGYTQILRDHYSPQHDEEGERICSVISDSVSDMSRLINDLLNFSRIGRAEMKSNPIDMAQLVASVYEELTSPEERRRIDFRVAPLQSATGDPSLLRQVWRNLIDNAIKFTSRRDQPRIEVSSEAIGHEIVYTIADNGAGFDMRYVDKLFGVFERLHRKEEFDGTGVGLAIVKRIVDRHRGRIWVEGEVDRGATFHMALGNPEAAD